MPCTDVFRLYVSVIAEACYTIEPNYNPPITYIICAKRHHVRFFPSTQDGGDRSGNVRAGTVVDMDVVHPTDNDFVSLSDRHSSSATGLVDTACNSVPHVSWWTAGNIKTNSLHCPSRREQTVCRCHPGTDLQPGLHLSSLNKISLHCLPGLLRSSRYVSFSLIRDATPLTDVCTCCLSFNSRYPRQSPSRPDRRRRFCYHGLQWQLW